MGGLPSAFQPVEPATDAPGGSVKTWSVDVAPCAMISIVAPSTSGLPSNVDWPGTSFPETTMLRSDASTSGFGSFTMNVVLRTGCPQEGSAVPVQMPDAQTSPVLHVSASEHPSASAKATCWQPLAGSHESVVQASLSSQSRSGRGRQTWASWSQ